MNNPLNIRKYLKIKPLNKDRMRSPLSIPENRSGQITSLAMGH